MVLYSLLECSQSKDINSSVESSSVLNMNTGANLNEDRHTKTSVIPGSAIIVKDSMRKKVLEKLFLVLALVIIWSLLSVPLVLYYTPLSPVSCIN